MISAQEAYRIGLVNEIVPAADLITRAEAILKKIAANAPIAVKFALEAANKGIETSQSEGLLFEASTSASAPPPKTRRKARRLSSRSACPDFKRPVKTDLRRTQRAREQFQWQTTIFSLD